MNTRRQRGMSFGGWLIVALLVFSAASVAIRLIPIYLDHRLLDSLISDLVATPEVAKMTSRQFREALRKDLRMNSIRNLELKDMLKFERLEGAVRVDLNYEVREPLVSNIDLILTFEEQYERVLN